MSAPPSAGPGGEAEQGGQAPGARAGRLAGEQVVGGHEHGRSARGLQRPGGEQQLERLRPGRRPGSPARRAARRRSRRCGCPAGREPLGQRAAQTASTTAYTPSTAATPATSVSSSRRIGGSARATIAVSASAMNPAAASGRRRAERVIARIVAGAGPGGTYGYPHRRRPGGRIVRRPASWERTWRSGGADPAGRCQEPLEPQRRTSLPLKSGACPSRPPPARTAGGRPARGTLSPPWTRDACAPARWWPPSRAPPCSPRCFSPGTATT